MILSDSKKDVQQHKEYWEKLSDFQKRYFDIRDRCYGGSFEAMLKDTERVLAKLLKGDDIVYDQVESLERTVIEVQKIMEYQEKHNVDLTQFRG